MSKSSQCILLTNQNDWLPFQQFSDPCIFLVSIKVCLCLFQFCISFSTFNSIITVSFNVPYVGHRVTNGRRKHCHTTEVKVNENKCLKFRLQSMYTITKTDSDTINLLFQSLPGTAATDCYRSVWLATKLTGIQPLLNQSLMLLEAPSALSAMQCTVSSAYYAWLTSLNAVMTMMISEVYMVNNSTLPCSCS